MQVSQQASTSDPNINMNFPTIGTFNAYLAPLNHSGIPPQKSGPNAPPGLTGHHCKHHIDTAGDHAIITTADFAKIMIDRTIVISCRILTALALCLGAFVNCACVSAQLESAMLQAATIRYVDDEDGDYWQSPAETIARGSGDCEDQAIYLHHLLAVEGLDSQVVFGIENLKRVESGHVWVEYPADCDVYVLDPTRRMIRLRSKLPRYQYYPALDQKLIQRKVEAYLKRSGQSGLNEHYEARIRAARER